MHFSSHYSSQSTRISRKLRGFFFIGSGTGGSAQVGDGWDIWSGECLFWEWWVVYVASRVCKEYWLRGIGLQLNMVELYAVKLMEHCLEDWTTETYANGQKEIEKQEWEEAQPCIGQAATGLSTAEVQLQTHCCSHQEHPRSWIHIFSNNSPSSSQTTPSCPSRYGGVAHFRGLRPSSSIYIIFTFSLSHSICG